MRTLEDLRGFWMPNQVKATKFRMVEESELRKEAIKLIGLSSVDKAKLITRTPKILLNEIIREDVAIIKAFQYFFNITDEDLK